CPEQSVGHNDLLRGAPRRARQYTARVLEYYAQHNPAAGVEYREISLCCFTSGKHVLPRIDKSTTPSPSYAHFSIRRRRPRLNRPLSSFSTMLWPTTPWIRMCCVGLVNTNRSSRLHNRTIANLVDGKMSDTIRDVHWPMALEPFYRAIETHPDYAGAEVQGSDSTMIPMRIAGYGDDTAVLVPDTTARLSTTTAFSQAAGLRVNESKRLGCHAADHTIEPTPYKVRHWWPTAKQLARLQRMVNTFVWDGDFQTDQRCRSWLKLSLASK
ncbi:TPA: hypothetical protein N0F65_002800, partial [Lagenidium giganteum]